MSVSTTPHVDGCDTCSDTVFDNDADVYTENDVGFDNDVVVDNDVDVVGGVDIEMLMPISMSLTMISVWTTPHLSTVLIDFDP